MENQIEVVKDSMKWINHVISRMKFLVETSIMPASSDDADAWYEAHADASHRILREDAERLQDVLHGLEDLFPNEEPAEEVELEEEQALENHQAIKTFPAGVISYSLFDDTWNYYQSFIGRLDLLTECAYETHKHEEVMDLICQIINQSEKESETFWDRALSEQKEAGGNGVMTVKQKIGGDPDKLIGGV